jgi:hypothetical protein
LLKGKNSLTLRHYGLAPAQCFSNATPQIAAPAVGKIPKSPMMPEEKNIKNV